MEVLLYFCVGTRVFVLIAHELKQLIFRIYPLQFFLVGIQRMYASSMFIITAITRTLDKSIIL